MFMPFFSNLGKRVRQLGHVRLKGRMRVRNSVCFECDTGNWATRGKPVEQREEEHTNSNHMRQTPTVHSVLRGDMRVPSPLRYPVPPQKLPLLHQLRKSRTVVWARNIDTLEG